MPDQRVTVEVELRASGNLTAALVTQRTLASRLGQAVTGARLAPQFSAATRAIQAMGRQLAGVTRQARDLARAVGISGPGGFAAGTARLPSIGSLVAGQLLAARLARSGAPSAASIRAAREQLISGHGARILALQQAGAAGLPGTIAARMHANSYLSAPLFQMQADEARRQQTADAARQRAEVRRDRFTMGSPAHRDLLLEQAKGQSEARRTVLRAQVEASKTLAGSMAGGMSPTYQRSSGMARKTYEDITATNRLAGAQAEISRLRAAIEISTLLPEGGEARKAMRAQLGAGRAGEARDQIARRVEAEVGLGEFSSPKARREMAGNIQLTYEAERATNQLAAARAKLERTQIGGPRHAAALRSEVEAATLQSGNALRQQLTQSQARLAYGGTRGGMTEMREQVRLQRQLAQSQSRERWQGMVVEQGRFMAGWQNLNEGLATFSDRLQGIRQTAGWVFAGITTGIAGAVAAGSPAAWETLTGSFRLLGGELGHVFIPAVRQVSEWLQEGWRWVMSWDEATRSTVRTVVLWTAGLSGVLWVGARLAPLLTLLSTGVYHVAAAIIRAAPAFMTFAISNPWIVGLSAASIAVLALSGSFDRLARSALDAGRAMLGLRAPRPGEIAPGAATPFEERARAALALLAPGERNVGFGTAADLQRIAAGGPGAAALINRLGVNPPMLRQLPAMGTSAPDVSEEEGRRFAFGQSLSPEARERVQAALAIVNARQVVAAIDAPMAELGRRARPETPEQVARFMGDMAEALRQTEVLGAQMMADRPDLAMRDRVALTRHLEGVAARRLAIEEAMPGLRAGGAGGPEGLLDFHRFTPQLMQPDQLYERILMQTQMSAGEQAQLEQQIRGNAIHERNEEALRNMQRSIERIENELRGRLDWKGF